MEELYKIFEEETKRIYAFLNSDNRIEYHYEGFNCEEEVKDVITASIISFDLKRSNPSDPTYSIQEYQAKIHAKLVINNSLFCKIKNQLFTYWQDPVVGCLAVVTHVN